jgi:hypothetical protein
MRHAILVRGNLVLALFAACLCLLIPTVASAADLVSINFNGDTPGLPPATGGANQPTTVFTIGGGTVLVQSSANGISTQPVVVSQDFAFAFAGLNADFAQVKSGLVRIEAAVGFSRLTFARFLATTDRSNGDEVTSLVATSSGDIQEEFSHTVVGTYSPNQPFRMRMDIDMSTKTWSASVDNELNGFADDPVISGLPFANVPSLISGVGELTSYLQVQDGLGSASVAFDDLTVSTPATSAELLADLHAALIGVGPGTSLVDKVSQAQTQLANNHVAGTCTTLTAFMNEVNAQSGKKIPSATADTLISDAQQIKTALGC